MSKLWQNLAQNRAIMPLMNIHIRDINKELMRQILGVSAVMFERGFLGIFYGSLSARISQDRFMINKSEAAFANLAAESLIVLDKTHDYRWNEASKDAHIHANLYENFSEAKFIAHAMPPYITAFSLKNAAFEPKDYFGYEYLGERIPIFDPKDFETWYERADTDIVRYLKQSGQEFIIVRGYGVYAYSRDIGEIAKKLDIIEQSAKILSLSQGLALNLQDNTYYGI